MRYGEPKRFASGKLSQGNALIDLFRACAVGANVETRPRNKSNQLLSGDLWDTQAQDRTAVATALRGIGIQTWDPT